MGDFREGLRFSVDDRGLFRSSDPLSSHLRTTEIKRRIFVLGNILLIVICVLLLGYLLVALLKPEKF
jgi:K+-transporting ATPase KdpF subunit